MGASFQSELLSFAHLFSAEKVASFFLKFFFISLFFSSWAFAQISLEELPTENKIESRSPLRAEGRRIRATAKKTEEAKADGAQQKTEAKNQELFKLEDLQENPALQQHSQGSVQSSLLEVEVQGLNYEPFVAGRNSSAELSDEESFHLASELEKLGYQKSALAYYTRLYRKPSLSLPLRQRVDDRILILEKSEKERKKTMVELEDFDNFKIASSLKQAQTEHPEEKNSFPRTTIDKKKWLIGAVVAVGVGVIAYKLYKDTRKETPPVPPPVFVIEF